MTRATVEWLAGASLVTAIVGGVVAMVNAAELNPFRARGAVYVHFDDVAFLSVGGIVRQNGTSVGMVESMELTDRGVLARLDVDPRVRVNDGARIQVRATTILGGRFVEIEEFDVRRPPAATSPAAPIAGRVEPGVGEGIAAIIESAEPYLASAVADIQQISEKISEAEGTVGLLLSDPALGDNLGRVATRLETTSATIRGMTRKIEEGAGTLGRLLREPRFERAVEGLGERVGSVADKLAGGAGPVGALAGDEDLGDAIQRAQERLVAIVDSLAEERERFGDGGRLGAIREKAQRTFADLERLGERFARGGGPLVVLSRDPDARADLDAVGEHLAEIANRPKRSTIGRIAEEPRVLDELGAAFFDFVTVNTDANEMPPLSRTLSNLVKGRFIEADEGIFGGGINGGESLFSTFSE